MIAVGALFVVLAVLALLGKRWAYFTFVAGGLLYFPASVGFHFHPQPCETAFTLSLAVYSLTNYGHLVRFAIFFLMSARQVRERKMLFATAAVLAFGIYVELAEGFTGNGHCRVRDLVPDLAGALIGAIILLTIERITRRAAAPSSSAPRA